MSEKVINPWNVNMSVIDDVQNRFQSGEYQQEIEVFGFLLYKEGQTTACVFADKDSCYQAYYRECLLKESFLSAVSSKCTIQSDSTPAKLKMCMDDFTAELAKKEYIAELLAASSKNYPHTQVDEELLKMADGNLDIIAWLLSEKMDMEPKSRNDYLSSRLNQYENGAFALLYQDEQDKKMRFFDMRAANVLERQEELAIKGLPSLLVYLGEKELGYAKLKAVLLEKEDTMRQLWQNICDYRSKQAKNEFAYALQTEDAMENRTFLKCKQLFA